jgi:hypothetical protein
MDSRQETSGMTNILTLFKNIQYITYNDLGVIKVTDSLSNYVLAVHGMV